MKRLVVFSCMLALVLGVLASDASACWDNSDQVIMKLKKLKLSTEQLKDIFAYQKEHRAVIARAHKEGLGCRYHENHDVVFQKKAIGVLNDAQFKKHMGRNRTEVESLSYQNHLLRKEIERLRAQLKRLQEALAQAARK